MESQSAHILTMTSAYPITPDGNHATFLRETMIRLQPAGTKFTVFAPAYEGSQGYVMDGINVHRFRYCIKKYENLARDGAPTKLQRQPLYLLAAATYILLGSIQLFWICLRDKPDILHVHWPFPHGLMAFPTSKLLGIPMVFSFHGAELLLMKKFSFVKPILKWLTRRAAAVTVNSSFTHKILQENVYAGEISVIPYGLTIEAKLPTSRNEGEMQKLLFVGRLDERKGLRYLLDAMPEILANQAVELRIIGKGHLEEEVKAQCKAMGLEESVNFLGFVTKEELADEYASCDVFVLPAIVDSKGDTEGLGIVMIEALAHRKPVIASNVGGISDVITHDETGILIPQREPKALAKAVLAILKDPERADRLARAGLADIQNRFSWQRILPQWQAVFNLTLSKPSQKLSGTLEQQA
ncbi:group 1 glycosyl transferase [Leptolyngbya sp. Heron Island J]|uniref:glycosyltransferase family 4 protein n=1 Tax=Leptolyngbya sp. Heron Island J TaxID=1385935 RepID=UPI0003B9ACEE|nr:glycosyltransferase family 4 protein [Leptolyngbya sp. Heron Island J]ESA33404.1 group 1 glycosyl transferase [Leptolyngbya sp. Heron Island J]